MMCLAVPGKVLSVTGHRAEVDFSGVSRQVDLSLLPEVKADDYVLVHAGCAIQIIPGRSHRDHRFIQRGLW